jgi:hypothetical protein
MVLSPQLLSSTHVTSLLSETMALRQAPALQLTLLLLSKMADWQVPTTVLIPVLSHSTSHCEKLDCTHEPLSHVCWQLTRLCPIATVKHPPVISSAARTEQCHLRYILRWERTRDAIFGTVESFGWKLCERTTHSTSCALPSNNGPMLKWLRLRLADPSQAIRGGYSSRAVSTSG